MKRLFLFTSFVIMIGLLSSCETAPRKVYPLISVPAAKGKRNTAVHYVGPGETFWRISKMYDVPIATILIANHLKNTRGLKMGQKLIIPNASPLRPVFTLYPSSKWRYIIVHHSATEEGNSLDFHKAHLNKGWDRGVGYHFVIDNGTHGKRDGEIEVTPRWIKQQDGAHCKASDMNTKAIGICLVGNFNNERVTKKQMASLVYLTRHLKNFYKIPLSHILMHRKVQGAKTQCPGKNFPWKKFLGRINTRSTH